KEMHGNVPLTTNSMKNKPDNETRHFLGGQFHIIPIRKTASGLTISSLKAEAGSVSNIPISTIVKIILFRIKSQERFKGNE
ncbi:hypothetical protein WA026_010331, partial [Henosepilachna vigintioctopunctata]